MLQDRPEPPGARVGNHLRQLIVDEEGAAGAASDAEAVSVRGPDVGEVRAERAGIAAEGHSSQPYQSGCHGGRTDSCRNSGKSRKQLGPKLRPDADFVLSFAASGEAPLDRANSCWWNGDAGRARSRPVRLSSEGVGGHTPATACELAGGNRRRVPPARRASGKPFYGPDSGAFPRGRVERREKSRRQVD